MFKHKGVGCPFQKLPPPRCMLLKAAVTDSWLEAQATTPFGLHAGSFSLEPRRILVAPHPISLPACPHFVVKYAIQ